MKRKYPYLCALFLAAFLIKALFILWISPNLLHLRPSRSWDQGLAIAENLLAGRGYQMTFWGLTYYSFRMPLYPLFLTGILAIWGKNLLAILLIQGLVFSLTAPFTYLLAHQIAGEKAGLWAGWMVAFSPAMNYYANFMIQEALATPFLVLSLFFLYKHFHNQKKTYIIITGFLLGLTSLSRTTFIPLPFFILLWWILHGWKAKTMVTHLLLLMLPLGVLLSPWIIYNKKVHGKPFLSTTDGGFVFFAWNSPEVLTNQDTAVQAAFFKDIAPYKKKLATMNEVERDQWFYRTRWESLKKQPILYLKAILKRIWNIWKPYPYKGGGTVMKNLIKIAPSLIFYLPVYILFILSLFSSAMPFKEIAMLLFLMIFITVTIPFFGGIIRVRLPIEPAMFTLVGIFLARQA